ncbi:FkbM family methyltransferase [Pyruvatibacter sp.]|uniref:FkbM family methyltransferase n=1 Tax=Pyruvatibacter sp. TaxID=1981328 RepID=UPI003264FAD9
MIKATLMRYLGPHAVDWGRRVLGRSGFDEVQLVYETFADSGFVGTMVDVGAHHGTSLGKFASDGWKVVAFEPDNLNRAFLEQAHGHRKNLHIDIRAVADQAQEALPFYGSDVSTGISGLSAFHESHEKRQVVEVTTLATALPPYDVSSVDFLKIDTEGHDLFVLKGLDWATQAPDAVVCEFEDRKTLPLGYSVRDLTTFLEDKGYRVLVSEWWPIEEYGSIHKWRRFVSPSQDTEGDAWGNLIAYRPSDRFARLDAIPRS